jgi:AcrR family transcriptional regulator
MTRGATKQRIVEAADDLFYRQGYAHTSFADIADAVSLSRGNFYHHFKTKDDILDAVIALRLERTRSMLRDWDAEAASPDDAIKHYIRILISNWSLIKDHGCPVGSLCTELAKLDSPFRAAAAEVFTLFRQWLKEKFILLGRRKEADALAMHVLLWSQGAATMGNAFSDLRYIKQEVNRMSAWLDALVKETP